jgi:hypothetical protein
MKFLEWLSKQSNDANCSEANLDELITEIGEQSLLQMPQYACLLLTPDFNDQQQLFSYLFRWFEKWQATPISVVPYKLTPSDVTLLYSRRTTHKNRQRRIHSEWLTHQLYASGTSLFIVLRSKCSEPPLQDVVRKAKGRSFYSQHNFNDLRGISRISDCCFSLLHSPDDYESFFRDAKMFLGVEGIRKTLNSTRNKLDINHIISLCEN